MKSILVSFIIPIYNSEKYIERLVDSILNQKLDSYEVILINDGSTDNTKEVLNKYKENKNIKIINKKNSGVSSTRNLGLSKAKGKYVMFADSDDFYEKISIKKILKKIKEETDILVFSSNREIENGEYVDLFLQENKIEDVTENFGINGYIFNDFESKYGNCIWNKVYKLEIIKNNNITFFENQTIAEDTLFNIQYFENVKKIQTISDKVYMYCLNQNSITHRFNNKYLDEYLKFGNNLGEFLKEKEYKNYHKAILKFYLNTCDFIIGNEACSKNIKESINGLKRYFTNDLITLSLKECKLKDFSKKYKNKYLMIKFKLYVFLYTLVKIKKGIKKCLTRSVML